VILAAVLLTEIIVKFTFHSRVYRLTSWLGDITMWKGNYY